MTILIVFEKGLLLSTRFHFFRVLNLFNLSRGALTQKHFEKEFSDVSLTTILPILNALQKEGMLDVLVNADRTLSWQLRDQNSTE